MVSRRVSYGPPGEASSTGAGSASLASFVRRHDPDRFLTALFAPQERRGALFALYAFNHELARAREVASDPTIALIRLQWWREVVEGARRGHEVAGPLRDALDAGLLAPGDLLAVIEAREAEAEPDIPTLSDWNAYSERSAGGIAVAAARLLGSADPEAFRAAGAAYGIAGVLRSVPALAARGRTLLPADVLARHGSSPEAAIAAPYAPALRQAIRELAAGALAVLAAGPRPSRSNPALAAALPAVLAGRDLRRAPDFLPYRSLADRLAVVRAGLMGM